MPQVHAETCLGGLWHHEHARVAQGCAMETRHASAQVQTHTKPPGAAEALGDRVSDIPTHWLTHEAAPSAVPLIHPILSALIRVILH